MACENHTETRELLREIEASAKSAHHRIDGVEEKVENQGNRITDLSCTSSANEKVVISLCEKLDGLISMIKWVIGICVPSVIAIAGLLIAILKEAK